MGFSPDPSRRLRQHNGELAGGDAPKGGQPWALVLVVHGFASAHDALAFESAWQRPHASRHTRHVWARDGFGRCSGRTTVAVRLAALALLLVNGAWAHCVLGVRVCVPEVCGSLRAVRQAAAEVTCGPWPPAPRRPLARSRRCCCVCPVVRSHIAHQFLLWAPWVGGRLRASEATCPSKVVQRPGPCSIDHSATSSRSASAAPRGGPTSCQTGSSMARLTPSPSWLR